MANSANAMMPRAPASRVSQPECSASPRMATKPRAIMMTPTVRKNEVVSENLARYRIDRPRRVPITFSRNGRNAPTIRPVAPRMVSKVRAAIAPTTPERLCAVVVWTAMSASFWLRRSAPPRTAVNRTLELSLAHLRTARYPPLPGLVVKLFVRPSARARVGPKATTSTGGDVADGGAARLLGLACACSRLVHGTGGDLLCHVLAPSAVAKTFLDVLVLPLPMVGPGFTWHRLLLSMGWREGRPDPRLGPHTSWARRRCGTAS